jgi:hypothetical protein
MSLVFLQAENSDFATQDMGQTPNSTANNAVPPISRFQFFPLIQYPKIKICREEFEDDIALYSFYYLVLGVAMFITSYIQVCF